ncbi:hypothetical protein G2W53_037035 [Senna tora]|uniref:Uncharacterized protein n=1 Tax=Senna tora TaxID=362788 RepID=A0A834W5P7_9FABA|nr:hypothetical protein G2W53_037035 [Senna tora]
MENMEHNTPIREGPRVIIDQEIINEQCQFWKHCLVGVLYDDGHIQDFRMQASIDEYWHLQNPVRVVVAEEVGNMVGDALHVDFSDQGFRNMRYLRVRVNIDPSKPLLMGFYVKLDNDHYI